MTDPKTVILDYVEQLSYDMEDVINELQESLNTIDCALMDIRNKKTGPDIHGWAKTIQPECTVVGADAVRLETLRSRIFALGCAMTEMKTGDTENMIPPDELGVYADSSGTVRVDSRDLAENIHLNHARLMQIIAEILVSENDNDVQDWFNPHAWQDPWEGQQIHYEITRDGLGLLPLDNIGDSGRGAEKYLTRMADMQTAVRIIKNSWEGRR